MHKNFLSIIILTLILHNAIGQEMLILKDAVAIGLENNFDIQIAGKDQVINANNNNWGNAGLYPTVDLSIAKNYQSQNVDLEIQGAEGTFRVTSDGAKSDRLNSNAALNWTVFDGLAMFFTKDKLEELENRGDLLKRVTVENTLAAIYNSYYQIVLEQDKLNVIEQTMEISNQRLSFAKERYDVGKGSKINYLAAQVDYNTDQSELLRQKELLSSAKINLNVLLGRESGYAFSVTENIDINEALQLEALLGRLNDFNPSLLTAVSDQNVAYLEYKELVAERYPRINLDLSYGKTIQNNEAGQLRSANTTGLSYGISATWNIFNGFNKTREIQNARINREITELEKAAMILDLEGAIHKTYINYSNNLELIKLENLNVDVALENVSIALDRYELGAGTSLELREAQRNAVDSQNRLLDAQLTAKLAEIELLRLTGSIIDKDRPVD